MGQLVFPAVLAVDIWRRGQAPGVAASGIWFLENWLNIARYLADARSMELPLVGGGDHHPLALEPLALRHMSRGQPQGSRLAGHWCQLPLARLAGPTGLESHLTSHSVRPACCSAAEGICI